MRSDITYTRLTEENTIYFHIYTKYSMMYLYCCCLHHIVYWFLMGNFHPKISNRYGCVVVVDFTRNNHLIDCYKMYVNDHPGTENFPWKIHRVKNQPTMLNVIKNFISKSFSCSPLFFYFVKYLCSSHSNSRIA